MQPTNNYATATASAAIVNFPPATSNVGVVIDSIHWSYSATPASPASILILDGPTVLYNVDITAAGPGFLPLQAAFNITGTNVLSVSLLSGGVGVVGKLNVIASYGGV